MNIEDARKAKEQLEIARAAAIAAFIACPGDKNLFNVANQITMGWSYYEGYIDAAKDAAGALDPLLTEIDDALAASGYYNDELGALGTVNDIIALAKRAEAADTEADKALAAAFSQRDAYKAVVDALLAGESPKNAAYWLRDVADRDEVRECPDSATDLRGVAAALAALPAALAGAEPPVG